MKAKCERVWKLHAALYSIDDSLPLYTLHAIDQRLHAGISHVAVSLSFSPSNRSVRFVCSPWDAIRIDSAVSKLSSVYLKAAQREKVEKRVKNTANLQYK